jgi:hypothetical protein
MPSAFNDFRVRVADQALRMVSDDEPKARMIDLLTNLMHWSHRNRVIDFERVSFDDCLRIARDHFTAETLDEVWDEVVDVPIMLRPTGDALDRLSG